MNPETIFWLFAIVVHALILTTVQLVVGLPVVYYAFRKYIDKS